MLKRHHLSIFFLILSILACNLPGNTPSQPATPTEISLAAAYTIAAQTVSAQLTQDGQQSGVTPNTPIPATTEAQQQQPVATTAIPAVVATTAAPVIAATTPVPVSPTPTQSCDKMQFVTDVTVPDGTVFSPGDNFVKTWRVKNVGTCSWTPSYALVYFSGEGMSGPTTVPLTGNVNPGDTLDLSISLKAPARAGTHTGYWKLRNASGVMFNQVYAMIKVADSSGGRFAVTRVEFSVAGACGNFTISAKITVSGPGEVTYKWLFSDGGVDTIVHDPIVFSAAGSKTITTTWATSAAGAKWVDLYVDSPNHQTLGRANFSCP